jgi:murein L,D-transpeptidase YcbB/YkuD
MRKNLLLWSAICLSVISCNYFKKKKQVAARDTTVNKITSFNNLFFDSAHLVAFIEQYPQYGVFADQYRDFYSHRNYEYAWFDTSGLAEQALNFYNLHNDYFSTYSDSLFRNKELNDLFDRFIHKKINPAFAKEEVLKTELLLTGHFFEYTSKMYKGSDIDATQLGWFIPRKKIDLTALLDSSLKAKGKETGMFASENSQYKKLEEAVQKYLALETASDTDTIPAVKKSLKKGDHSSTIKQVKQKLLQFGDMEIKDSSDLFDSTLLTATRLFQKRMGLTIDGVIGNKMIAELNIPVSKRIRQLLVNMERVRWMPIENDSNFIVVNIPEYKMHVYDSGRLAYNMNVIVGTATNSTVIFSGNLKYIVFSPFWNVPESIVKKEIMPSMKKNPNYIAKNNMEITGYSGSIPIVRQTPGRSNSLGLVKFLFPNNYNIYLHDTPNHELFSQSSRSFSHGCIRLGDPKKFAEYLLRDDSAWNRHTIDSAMHLSKEKWVTIKKSVPVYIVYFTAWVDQDGLLNFRKDIYGHDARMEEKLFAN